MKKLVTFLLALAVCLPVFGEYPDEIAGEQLQGSHEFVVALVDVFNVPYSVPDLGRYGFKGEYYSDGEILAVYLDCAWDLQQGHCIGPAPQEYINGEILLWNSDAQCYLSETPVSGDRVTFEAWSGAPNFILWTLGCFDIELGDPYVNFLLSDDCSLFFYEGYIGDPVPMHRGKSADAYE